MSELEQKKGLEEQRTCRQATQSWFRIDDSAKTALLKTVTGFLRKRNESLVDALPFTMFFDPQNIMRRNRADNRSINLGWAVILRRITAECINEARQN